LGQSKPKLSLPAGPDNRVDYDEGAIMRAWESFVADGDDDARLDTHVRPLIQQSWHRCALSSIDAGRGEAPLARDEEVVERLRHASQELRDAARDLFGRVGRLLEGAQAMLILTDHEGVIVETVGDHRASSSPSATKLSHARMIAPSS
jgi:transcriptional regulator of acetoin/glycerol metabolism